MNGTAQVSKEKLKEKIIENVKTFSRKTLETASAEHIYEALAYTIPGIIAHESAMRGGELLKIPVFD